MPDDLTRQIDWPQYPFPDAKVMTSLDDQPPVIKRISSHCIPGPAPEPADEHTSPDPPIDQIQYLEDIKSRLQAENTTLRARISELRRNLHIPERCCRCCGAETFDTSDICADCADVQARRDEW